MPIPSPVLLNVHCQLKTIHFSKTYDRAMDGVIYRQSRVVGGRVFQSNLAISGHELEYGSRKVIALRLLAQRRELLAVARAADVWVGSDFSPVWYPDDDG